MNDKRKFFTEKELEEIALKLHKEKLNYSIEKEKYISQLPYSDEYPRIYHEKTMTCYGNIIRIFWKSLVCGLFSCPLYSSVYYST